MSVCLTENFLFLQNELTPRNDRHGRNELLIEYIQYQAHLPHPDLRQESASSGSKKGNLLWGIDKCLGATQSVVQVNLCQKFLFLHQLTHNMTTDCSLNYKFNTEK